jgi:hypothetical protein
MHAVAPARLAGISRGLWSGGIKSELPVGRRFGWGIGSLLVMVVRMAGRSSWPAVVEAEDNPLLLQMASCVPFRFAGLHLTAGLDCCLVVAWRSGRALARSGSHCRQAVWRDLWRPSFQGVGRSGGVAIRRIAQLVNGVLLLAD